MMFTDQRWIDLVPSLFEHHILKDPGYNVAYWNLHERDVAWTGDGFVVNGRPLTFFHFSGYDPAKPHLLSKHQVHLPRILLSERPDVRRICDEYHKDLTRLGWPLDAPYGWDWPPSGLRFDERMRRIYRAALLAFESGDGEEPPVPFSSEDAFLSWLSEPVTAGGLASPMPRYLQTIYQERADLQTAFPALAGGDRARYFLWLHSYGIDEEQVPRALLPRVEAAPSSGPFEPAFGLREGINVVGYYKAESGIGQAARLITASIEGVDVDHETMAYDATTNRLSEAFEARGTGRAPFDVTILCINADSTPSFAREAGPDFFDGRHTIGYWFWELERFPPSMHRAFDYVDEVWTATRFVADSVRAIGRRPVHTIPLPVPLPVCAPHITRASLRLPPGFLFLFAFDFFSILDRKNPLGVIAAFSRAFRPGEGPTLVLKSINGRHCLNDLERVRAAARDRPDIRIIDQSYSEAEKNALLGLCDCYVSLHRSEGLGLTMAEAMALEKPVIATAYSGNLDFMTTDNSYLVDYTLGRVPFGCDPYPTGAAWAEPDYDMAADLMRRVVHGTSEAARLARRARHDVLSRHTLERTGAAIVARLEAVRVARRQAAFMASRTPASSSKIAAGTAPEPSLDEAERLLTPEASVAPGRSVPRVRKAAQRLLFRLLRPYWWGQRTLNSILIERLRGTTATAERLSASDRQHNQRIDRLYSAVAELQAGLEEVKDGTALAAIRHTRASARPTDGLVPERHGDGRFRVEGRSDSRTHHAVTDVPVGVKPAAEPATGKQGRELADSSTTV
jgi:glycosyltransferase involved in cell wall biosynthesis